MDMYCFQCQEAARNTACTSVGVCGKDEEISDLLDILVYLTKGISWWANRAAEKGIADAGVDTFVVEALFTTVTNVTFDPAALIAMIEQAKVVRATAHALAGEPAAGVTIPDAARWEGTHDERAMIGKAESLIGVLAEDNVDIRSLKELLAYGIKGAAAYVHHASVLGHSNRKIEAFFHKALASMLRTDITGDELLGLILECGNHCVSALELLDTANTTRFGHPEATAVSTAIKAGPGILVSGHDLKDLQELLEQTAGTGINVYTHCEMLPAHAYPELKKHPHLAGHFGGAWHAQQTELENFGGAILFNTNCIQKPKDSYKNRMFTTGFVGWPGLAHIADPHHGKPKDFSALIARAKELGSLKATQGGTITTGFARNQVMAVAGKVVDAVKNGDIRRFVVMAGCDGRQPERSYFTDLAKALPKDAVILTAGCAKFRYNQLELGDIGGIPRMLDAGQCNDSYSLAYIALQLKEVFGAADINDLPVDFAIGWYEQKAVCVLLALLALGFKGVRLGPTLPAFLSPNVAAKLVEAFDLKAITTVEADLPAIMGEVAV